MIQVSESITLREIVLQDQSKLYSLMQEIYTPVYRHLWVDAGKSYLQKTYNIEQLQKDLEEPDTLYCFVQYQSKSIGIVRLLENEPTSHFKGQKALKLQRIYLGDAAQGRGIGKALMQWIAKRAKALDSSIFWLEVMDTQDKAIGFYESLGFQKFNEVLFPSELMLEDYQGMYQMYKPVS